jgi:hypothetical protein
MKDDILILGTDNGELLVISSGLEYKGILQNSPKGKYRIEVII